ncbi:mitochondrial ribosomal protein subunit-domain-containing protein [Lipomyces japonicus]|uniref:mitochondrial 37S ribosomal protein bS1m n=1 Tax=Lipomyces japonicus TaxID=56871 RepID=UPI0034CFA426
MTAHTAASGGATQFQIALRNSRLVSLPQRLTTTSQSLYPTKQVIEAPPVAFARRDFGLKAPLPAKSKSSHVVVEQVDTIEGFTSFYPATRFYRTLKRVRELKKPVSQPQISPQSLNQRLAANSASFSNLLSNDDKITEYYAGKTLLYVWAEQQRINSKTKGEFKSIGKKELENSLKVTEEDINLLNQIAKQSPGQSINQSPPATTIPSSFSSNRTKYETGAHDLEVFTHSVRANAGLSYSLKGRAYRTPLSGVVEQAVFSGRELGPFSRTSTQSAVLLAGVTASEENPNASRFSRFQVKPFTIENLGVSNIGAIKLHVKENKPVGAAAKRSTIASYRELSDNLAKYDSVRISESKETDVSNNSNSSNQVSEEELYERLIHSLKNENEDEK